MPIVSFQPLEKQREVKNGATILAAANQCDAPIGQSCNGDGICGWCKVKVLSGLQELDLPSRLEQRLIETNGFSPDERAACLARVRGDVIVTTSYWTK
jgi:ferredoxin